jgi:hypothetical protein
MATVAAPMLAGFTVTLIGVVAQADDRFRYPELSLLLLTLAAAALITCVQAGFWFQRPVPHTSVRRWRSVARLSYDGGIVMLFAALSTVLTPMDTSQLVRWVAAGVALAAALAEIVWSVVGRARGRL